MEKNKLRGIICFVGVGEDNEIGTLIFLTE